MKKTFLMTSSISILAVVAFFAFADHTDEGKDFDQMMADGLLELKVKANLLEELGWDAMSIDVAADADDLTLSGTVEKETTKEMAKQIAKSIEGVDTVDNRVKVAKDAENSDKPVTKAVGNAESEVKDALLEGRIKTKLLGELGRHGFGINVEVTDGVVSLRGEVADEKRHELALEAARSCKGVDRVIDLLKVEDS